MSGPGFQVGFSHVLPEPTCAQNIQTYRFVFQTQIVLNLSLVFGPFLFSLSETAAKKNLNMTAIKSVSLSIFFLNGFR